MMKVKPSIKTECDNCQLTTRKKRNVIICDNPKHKQRQG